MTGCQENRGGRGLASIEAAGGTWRPFGSNAAGAGAAGAVAAAAAPAS
jgi:hypothetical protein